MARTESNAAVSCHEEPWTRFAAWAVDELGCVLAYDGSVYRLQIDTFDAPSEGSQRSGGKSDQEATPSTIRRRWSLRRSGRKAQANVEAEAAGPLLTATTQLELLTGIVAKLLERPMPPSVRPVRQPHAVHELTDRFFEAYQLDGGKAHMAGCHLEEVPFVRRTRIDSVADSDTDQVAVWHSYFDEQGKPVADQLVEELGLNQVESARDSAPRVTPRLVERLSLSTTTQDKSVADKENANELQTIVWARRATGRIRFEFGDESVDAPFDGWVKTLSAPAIICPRTGRETFSLTTVEGGDIVAAEEVVLCEVTDHRHIASDLDRCAETNKLVEPELLEPCPITGDWVLSTEFVPCPRCQQSVPKGKATATGCKGCDGAKRVGTNHPVLQAIQAKHPAFAKQGWQLAETQRAVILVRDGWLRRRVATFDKATLELLHEAEASRFSATWRPV